MFSWFFRKSSPVEVHTSYIDTHTWVAELNGGDQLQTIKELFAVTFDADNFVVIDDTTSVTATLIGEEKYQCTLTFGYNGDNKRIAVIAYNDDEDESIVKPTINAFSVELESYSLLSDQPIKEQKPIENSMIPMKEVVEDKDIINDEENLSFSGMLRENVDIKKMLAKVVKYGKEKAMLEVKTEAGKLCFVEKGNETFKIVIQIGRNSEKQRVMSLTANEKRPYWKELVEGIITILMKGRCFNSYALNAALRKTLKSTSKVVKNNTIVEENKEVALDLEKTNTGEGKETKEDKKTEEMKEEKKDVAIEVGTL
ncbi:hypothetical protein EIN_429100 [Entamoeba invadens IP1]|uniref:Uncharacterized protein n=2 Tax=Entamoeba invadens TaxID=33085 RepID=A0A0A1UGU4_ENTIV|nr:hypothetical protein EIN_429100 [Entamoeba invadens IP1]ELP95164.1 hypothetical protein EIN_429100 [Entamoeba invadens IP1]BAN40391.1 hypothetical protein [Entamoeba invadens]BAN41468.1 hypothetical protein [Entamoeba invadens]|eukprot:XP_004261935.1 hypothetical protein EIN_429100 [Entamoeba invadens IP1]